jgi:hypothetical protein
MEILFCLRDENAAPGTVGTPCHTNISITSTDHSHEFRADGFAFGLCENLEGRVRIIGHWNVTPDAGHPAIEIAP